MGQLKKIGAREMVAGLKRPAAIVRSDGRIEIIENTGYEVLQAAVGGWIESLGLEDRGRLWCHEEGRIRGLPPNWLASKIVDEVYAKQGETFPIVGDVVIVGVDPDGEDGPIPIGTLERIFELRDLLDPWAAVQSFRREVK